MNATDAPLFLQNKETEDLARQQLRALAGRHTHVASRFIFHNHLYEANRALTPREVINIYLKHLGYRSGTADFLYEISIDSAFALVERVLHFDLARQEEVMTKDQAQGYAELLRSIIEPSAILCFTNLHTPIQLNNPAGTAFVRVVAPNNAEGGVIFVGEQDLAMAWFLDDDGPSRSIWSIGQ